jgi:hypothetical protein
LSQDLTRSQWSGKRDWIHFSPWNPKQEMISQQIRLDLDWIEYSKNKSKTSHLNKASQIPPNGSHHHQHKKISQKTKPVAHASHKMQMETSFTPPTHHILFTTFWFNL